MIHFIIKKNTAILQLYRFLSSIIHFPVILKCVSQQNIHKCFRMRSTDSVTNSVCIFIFSNPPLRISSLNALRPHVEREWVVAGLISPLLTPVIYPANSHCLSLAEHAVNIGYLPTKVQQLTLSVRKNDTYCALFQSTDLLHLFIVLRPQYEPGFIKQLPQHTTV